MKPRILLFEDEMGIAETLKYAFKTEGFLFEHASTASAGLSKFAAEHFDLIILDVGLPDKNVFEVCREIRARSKIPVFFLTARMDEIDKILGLEIGADDYIAKPFSPRELTARIRAFFRRFSPDKTAPEKQVDDFSISEERFQIRYKGHDLELRRYEFGILKLLLEHPGRVFSRIQIMENIWSDPHMSLERTIDTHIKVIRAKIKVFTQEDLIQTHRALGYSVRSRD